MLNKKKLQRSLNKVTTPNDLVKDIHNNWQMQQKNSKSGTKYFVGLSTAAVLFVTVLIFFQTYSTPKLITTAWADIRKDDEKNIGISVPLETIRHNTGIGDSLENIAVKMTKACTLDRTKTLHIKIAEKNHGFVHLFIKKGNFSLYPWQSHEGENKHVNWQIISPQKNLSVLVLRTPEVSKAQITKLVHKLFYS